MKALIDALHAFSAKNAAHVAAFGKLQLKDLGFYVSDDHATRYHADHSYPIAEKAFLLENALNQCSFHGPTSQEMQGSFVEHNWMNGREDVVGCSTLLESSAVSLCWFVLPPRRSLPLHNHPGMSVWQRVMFGQVRICSIDWCNNNMSSASGAASSPLEDQRAAVGGEGVVVFAGDVAGNGDALQSEDDILHFSSNNGGGVLHEIANLDDHVPALFVDIISPPYLHPPANATCTYFTAQKLTDTAISSASTESGILTPNLSVGDRVRLAPRSMVDVPMQAFVHIG